MKILVIILFNVEKNVSFQKHRYSKRITSDVNKTVDFFDWIGCHSVNLANFAKQNKEIIYLAIIIDIG